MDLTAHSDAALLEALARRHASRHVYTYSGPRVCVSLNPYDWSVSRPLYTEAVRSTFLHAPEGDLCGGRRALPPHLYAVAEQARRRRASPGAPQALLVGGESGAGKTEAVKILLSYLCESSSSPPPRPPSICDSLSTPPKAPSSADAPLVDRLIELNPLLEAFGNACTCLNHNSSRFGKLITLQYEATTEGTEGGRIVGGRISSYLLEKVRVVQHSEGEACFHIFHQLLSGLPPDEAARLGLRTESHVPKAGQEWSMEDEGDENIDTSNAPIPSSPKPAVLSQKADGWRSPLSPSTRIASAAYSLVKGIVGGSPSRTEGVSRDASTLSSDQDRRQPQRDLDGRERAGGARTASGTASASGAASTDTSPASSTSSDGSVGVHTLLLPSSHDGSGRRSPHVSPSTSPNSGGGGSARALRGLPTVASHSASAWRKTSAAARAVGVTSEEMRGVTEVLAAILHLGDVRFVESDGVSSLSASSESSVRLASHCLGVSRAQLQHVLAHTARRGVPARVRFRSARSRPVPAMPHMGVETSL